MYSPQRLLSCFWSSGESSNVIMASNSSDNSRFALSGRISNRSVFRLMSSSSAMASSSVGLRTYRHGVQGCAETLLAFANDGFTGGTDWLRFSARRRLIDAMRKFVYEMVFLDYGAADDAVNAAGKVSNSNV